QDPAGNEGAAPGVGAEQKALALSLEGASPGALPAPHRVISVTCDLNATDIAVLAGRYLGVVSPTESVRPASWSLHQTSERLSVIEGTLVTPEIHYGWVAPGDADDTATLRVAFEILAGSDAARLPRLLVPRGLARHVGIWSTAELPRTLFGIVVETTPRTSVDRVRRFIDGSIKQLRLVGPSEREVARAVAVLRRRALETWEDPEARARALAESELVTGDARHFGAEAESLTRVKAERVRARTHDLLIDARRTTIETYPALWPADDPALARHQLYTVAAGDTLGSLAARFHADPARLAKDNDIDPRYRLMPGQPLWIAPVTPIDP
ncbi:MAG TPA: LysM peptidoglycan-binding domain-containing protein, partial [Polyangiaceae bacterium]